MASRRPAGSAKAPGRGTGSTTNPPRACSGEIDDFAAVAAERGQSPRIGRSRPRPMGQGEPDDRLPDDDRRLGLDPPDRGAAETRGPGTSRRGRCRRPGSAPCAGPGDRQRRRLDRPVLGVEQELARDGPTPPTARAPTAPARTPAPRRRRPQSAWPPSGTASWSL